MRRYQDHPFGAEIAMTARPDPDYILMDMTAMQISEVNRADVVLWRESWFTGYECLMEYFSLRVKVLAIQAMVCLYEMLVIGGVI